MSTCELSVTYICSTVPRQKRLFALADCHGSSMSIEANIVSFFIGTFSGKFDRLTDG